MKTLFLFIFLFISMYLIIDGLYNLIVYKSALNYIIKKNKYTLTKTFLKCTEIYNNYSSLLNKGEIYYYLYNIMNFLKINNKYKYDIYTKYMDIYYKSMEYMAEYKQNIDKLKILMDETKLNNS